MADPISTFVNGLTQKAVASASDAAAAQASAQWEQYKPQVYALSIIVGFMAVTVYLFYFVPRFLPFWKRAS